MSEPLRPRRALPFETGADGRVTVVRAKVLRPRWRWLLRFLARPDFRVRLDERGSFVWGLCDGTRTVAEIAAAVQARFQDPPEDSGQRTGLFLHQLLRGGFLDDGD